MIAYIEEQFYTVMPESTTLPLFVNQVNEVGQVKYGKLCNSLPKLKD